MKKIIENIRQKPEPVRRQIIFVVSLVLTGLIVLFWVFTLPYRFGGTGDKLKQSLKPFELLKDNISGTIEGISDQVR